MVADVWKEIALYICYTQVAIVGHLLLKHLWYSSDDFMAVDRSSVNKCAKSIVLSSANRFFSQSRKLIEMSRLDRMFWRKKMKRFLFDTC